MADQDDENEGPQRPDPDAEDDGEGDEEGPPRPTAEDDEADAEGEGLVGPAAPPPAKRRKVNASMQALYRKERYNYCDQFTRHTDTIIRIVSIKAHPSFHAVYRSGALSVTEIKFDMWSVQTHTQAVAILYGHTMPVALVIDSCRKHLHPRHHCEPILFLRRPPRRQSPLLNA